MKIKVNNMQSRNGNLVPNQFVIYQGQNVFFQSYKSVIAKLDKNNKLTLDVNKWDYSITTLKYLYSFIEEFKGFRPNKKSLNQLIEEKQIKLTDLN